VYRDGRWLDTREPTLDARLLVVEVNLLSQMRVDAACPGKTEGLLVADDPIPLHGRQCRVPSNGWAPSAVRVDRSDKRSTQCAVRATARDNGYVVKAPFAH